ncbi:aminoglycoside 6-adenylyltransferase [Clostridiaceae bacterium M8S5]|nr:aminoglycoside 6-adenylyltransferase [Clostridiaceae bacterium M8S5]
MKTEDKILDLILRYAKEDEDVRAVLMNGSRVNPNVDDDDFSDYDVVFAVNNPDKYIKDTSFIEFFGKPIMIQQNDIFANNQKYYMYLMLFEGDFRIDLQFFPAKHIQARNYDSLEILLLDKDNTIDNLPAPTDEIYRVNRPMKYEFEHCLNNFFWCMNNVVKGICRDELCYVKSMFDMVIRNNMISIIDWYIGINYDWKINTGKFGKWYKKFLREDIYELLEKTYAGYDYNDIWDSIECSFELIRKIAKPLSEQLGYEYPYEDDKNMYDYVKRYKDKYLEN